MFSESSNYSLKHQDFLFKSSYFQISLFVKFCKNISYNLQDFSFWISVATWANKPHSLHMSSIFPGFPTEELVINNGVPAMTSLQSILLERSEINRLSSPKNNGKLFLLASNKNLLNVQSW